MKCFYLAKRYLKVLLVAIFVYFFFQILYFLLSTLKESYFVFNNWSSVITVADKLKKYHSPELKVELKDVNISYYYDGYGEHACSTSSVLIATLSRPNAFDLRMAVRNSWRKDIPSTYTHRFFIGWSQNDTLRNALKKESHQFEDIVFITLTDSYLNLTLKMTALYQWHLFYCPKAEYFLRADEDTVLDVVRFQYWLNKYFNIISKNLNKMVIFGDLFEKRPVLRKPSEKWFVSYEAYNNSVYPDFVQGPSYLATSTAIKSMLIEAKNHKHVNVDDAFFTGIIAEDAGITRIDSTKHFAYGNPLNTWKQECDEYGIPFLFSIFDENGEIESVPKGYDTALKKLKNLRCRIKKSIF